jgi:antitoxin ParD1/3/4
MMATMNVSLPDAMKDWVEGRTETGRYSNSSDYVRDLIRRDQEREAKIKAMQKLIDEAIEGGESELSVEEIFDSVRQRARENAGP